MFVILNNSEVFPVNHLSVSKAKDTLAIVSTSLEFKNSTKEKQYHTIQFYIDDNRYIGVGEFSYNEGNYFMFSGDLDIENIDAKENI